MIPKFLFSAEGPVAKGTLKLFDCGLIYAKCDKFPVASITDANIELVLEFNEASVLVSVHVLREITAIKRGKVVPVLESDAKQGYAQLVDNNCDREFTEKFIYDKSQGLLEIKFSDLPSKTTIRWCKHAFIELANDGLIVRIILDTKP